LDVVADSMLISPSKTQKVPRQGEREVYFPAPEYANEREAFYGIAPLVVTTGKRASQPPGGGSG
jgi:hypothetical protein